MDWEQQLARSSGGGAHPSRRGCLGLGATGEAKDWVEFAVDGQMQRLLLAAGNNVGIGQGVVGSPRFVPSQMPALDGNGTRCISESQGDPLLQLTRGEAQHLQTKLLSPNIS